MADRFSAAKLLDACIATFTEPVRPQQRHKAEPGECSYCDGERATENNFHPPHDASPRCESGRRDHCSCAACF